jgi:hypothetical protein
VKVGWIQVGKMEYFNFMHKEKKVSFLSETENIEKDKILLENGISMDKTFNGFFVSCCVNFFYKLQ